jgi:pSer/pThr/pTyr-binding forkhead associated (FHA) protein
VRSDRLRFLLRNDRYYVAPLRKRTEEETFRDRVSVGRAVNKDVVLRHPNVSKLHAWFELDETGGLYVADAGSSNGTFLNHEKLAPRELTAVEPGHHLRFGSVEAVVYAAPALWRAIRRG